MPIGEHLLGWKPHDDPRDGNYPFRRYLTVADYRLAQAITHTTWQVSRVLDQGETNHCVGFGWAGWGICLPVFDDFTDADGHKIYYLAKDAEGESGWENGSTTLAGARAMQSLGRLRTYAWAQNIDDVITWVLTRGPIVTGTNWYSAMFMPDSNGFVKIDGDYRGGHEYYINECNTSLRFLGFVNSWGEKFGLGGKFYMTFETYAELLRQNGDACTAPELPLLPEPVPSNPGCNPMEKARNIWRAIRE